LIKVNYPLDGSILAELCPLSFLNYLKVPIFAANFLTMNLSSMREEYAKAGLSREDLFANPVQQFEKWFQQAEDSGMEMSNAMTLATVSGEGQPSVRTVLLKYFDADGFVFYTNFGSSKARDIAENPKVAVLFPWLDLERQVKITGTAEKVPTATSAKYFLSRPRGSQIGAWVSNQSSPITSRQMLMSKFEEMLRKFENKEVPLPSFWGGYRVVPSSFEFWQGRKNRLHDRFLYTPDGAGEWKIERLAP
jgi:pyridoxamine 5'-phosphate oxidase